MNILFLCVANSARSQLAEGLARSIFGDAVTVASAGSNPSGKVSKYAIEVLKEVGIDISKNTSKSWDVLSPSFLNKLDYVITLCAEEICPNVAVAAKKIHWGLPDPATAGNSDTERLEAFRRTRDEIRRRLENFQGELTK